MNSESDSNKPVVETWNGSCHCGNVKYKVDMHNSLYDGDTVSCNCSICQRNGYLFIYPENANVTWLSGKDTLKAYHFASKRIGHRFCPECGTSVCGFSDTEGFLQGFMALNVRTFENVELEKLKLRKMDGRKLTYGTKDYEDELEKLYN